MAAGTTGYGNTRTSTPYRHMDQVNHRVRQKLTASGTNSFTSPTHKHCTSSIVLNVIGRLNSAERIHIYLWQTTVQGLVTCTSIIFEQGILRLKGHSHHSNLAPTRVVIVLSKANMTIYVTGNTKVEHCGQIQVSCGSLNSDFVYKNKQDFKILLPRVIVVLSQLY
jgi:hypothetical protein